jgi:probable HAF family extracellular repeat protein
VAPGDPFLTFGINDLGQVVGTYGWGFGTPTGFVDTNGVFKYITVPGSTGTVAQGINNLGQIVGWYWDIHGQTHGFLDDNGVFTTIDPPTNGRGQETRLTGINDLGQIVGGDPSYIPSPEPAPLLLIFAGFGAAALLQPRRGYKVKATQSAPTKYP